MAQKPFELRCLTRVMLMDALSPIAGADAIEVAKVGGWTVVIKKGEFKPGDRAVYFAIDSFLPVGNPAWQFLLDKSTRRFNDLTGPLHLGTQGRGCRQSAC